MGRPLCAYVGIRCSCLVLHGSPVKLGKKSSVKPLNLKITEADATYIYIHVKACALSGYCRECSARFPVSRTPVSWLIKRHILSCHSRDPKYKLCVTHWWYLKQFDGWLLARINRQHSARHCPMHCAHLLALISRLTLAPSSQALCFSSPEETLKVSQLFPFWVVNFYVLQYEQVLHLLLREKLLFPFWTANSHVLQYQLAVWASFKSAFEKNKMAVRTPGSWRVAVA